MDEFSIATSDELIAILRFVREELDNGRIQSFHASGNEDSYPIPSQEKITQISWPDTFANYYKETTTGRIYKLYVDVFQKKGYMVSVDGGEAE